ncbi:choline transporter [Thiomicrospira aerophila AL3]|uniref:Choline transporter n=1 Tax=Thiomicrospira aerophila AL3 TaxID=717772 RepID=W0DTB4_9GAMM|nr:choline BCCT transporter BetT [Thiomicrospira aerophila]AHF00528.1 choline transporter [Thiomicrospira aerophila AL3]
MQLFKPAKFQINPPVFFSSALLTLALVLYTIVFNDSANAVFSATLGWISAQLGWFYVLSVAGFLVFIAIIALSRFGNVKLGTEHSKPEFTNLSWFAMLFSAGMGIGLMFFGVAEPVMHYVSPPVGDPETAEAARQAMRITFFHWGVHAWAIYAIVAMSLAYFAFRHNMPMTIRSSLYPLIGERIHGPIGHAVDTFAVLGTLFGVATSLGFGVMQINAGLNYLFGVPVGVMTQIILIAVITGIATISVALGLAGGIRRLSILNMIFAAALLAFVLVTGPTVFQLQTLVQNTGMYVSDLLSMTFNLYAYEPTDWIGGWTLFYWGWWIAWAPFVGMFIAMVSKGRTIREFVLGVLLVPVGFTFMWMTFFGGTALHMIMVQGITELADAVAADTSVALFQFLEHLPLSSITAIIATLLIITFFVTSADSGSLVVDRLTSGGTGESHTWQRIFWAVIQGVLAAGLLLAGGLGALQTATIASAFPFVIIMILMAWGLARSLRLDVAKHSALAAPRLTDSQMDWKTRLKTLVSMPQKKEVLKFIDTTVTPALHEVSNELKKQGLDARVQRGEDGRAWLEIRHDDDHIDFFYSARPQAYEPTALIMRDAAEKAEDAKKYYRIEVHLGEGGQDYDIMGWTKETILNDVLEQYSRHVMFLNQVNN